MVLGIRKITYVPKKIGIGTSPWRVVNKATGKPSGRACTTRQIAAKQCNKRNR